MTARSASPVKRHAIARCRGPLPASRGLRPGRAVSDNDKVDLLGTFERGHRPEHGIEPMPVADEADEAQHYRALVSTPGRK